MTVGRCLSKIRLDRKTKELEIKEFITLTHTLKDKIEPIINFYIYRNSNANADSFKDKIILFGANHRGIIDIKFTIQIREPFCLIPIKYTLHFVKRYLKN